MISQKTTGTTIGAEFSSFIKFMYFGYWIGGG